MRVITLNVNGIRSAAAKGLFPWLLQQDADVVCLQEVRAHQEQCAVHDTALPGYHCAYYPAQRAGYAGVALYSREAPGRLVRRLRRDRVRPRGPLPRGAVRRRGRRLAVPALGIGGTGTAALEVPVPRGNSCRTWLRSVAAGDTTYCAATGTSRTGRSTCGTGARTRRTRDSCRTSAPGWTNCSTSSVSSTPSAASMPSPTSTPGGRTAGSRGRKNVGWRIDYQVTSPRLAGAARAAQIYRERRFSDHAPLIMDYEL